MRRSRPPGPRCRGERRGAERFDQVVARADEAPLGGSRLQAAKREPPEPDRALGRAEHELDQDLPFGVDRSASRRCHLRMHRPARHERWRVRYGDELHDVRPGASQSGGAPQLAASARPSGALPRVACREVPLRIMILLSGSVKLAAHSTSASGGGRLDAVFRQLRRARATALVAVVIIAGIKFRRRPLHLAGVGGGRLLSSGVVVRSSSL